MTLTRQQLRAARIENGLCGECGNPARTKKGRPDITLSRCNPCETRARKKQREQRKQRSYYNRRGAGVCVDCGKPALVLSCGLVRSRCKAHLESTRKAWREWRLREATKASTETSVR